MAPPILLVLLWTVSLPPALAGSHSHRYFSSALSEELPGVPQFTAVGYVDDEAIEAYSSWSRRKEPRAPWMGRVAESDPRYWESQTEIARGNEAVRRANVKTVMGRHNQSAGLHVVQVMVGCELRDDGSIGGFLQFAYDGRDLLSFDKENMKFTAATDAARATADRWNTEGLLAQRYKTYLEQECIEWLQRYLHYGNESLLRRVPPRAMISRRKSDTATTLTCNAFGFYPRHIEVKWVRNGVEVGTETKNILPNTNGTYQIRTTVELPEGHDEKDYQCQVYHISLEKTLIVVYKEESGAWYILLTVGVIVGVGIVVALITATVIWKRKHPDQGNTAADLAANQYTAVSIDGEAGPYSSSRNSCA